MYTHVMSSNNILYICNEMLENVVIMTDTKGKNELDSLPKLKYNQHLLNRTIDNLKKDSVLINDQIHSDCIVIVDEHGNNVLKSKDEISIENPPDENNLFMNVLKQIHVDKEPANIEEFLLKKRESLQSKLKSATYYFNMKSFIKCCDLYKEVLTLIDTDMYPDEFMLNDTDILAIKFAYALSKMAICKMNELQIAANILTVLKTEHGDEFPTLYYYLARCLYLLEKYEEAKEVLTCAQDKLKDLEFLSELNWPGSDNKMIVRTEKPLLMENIETLFKECNEFRLPDVKCIFFGCENRNIFFDSPCFNGYVVVKCSNKCNFCYHRNCWKLKLKVDCVKKPSYFLGNICATDDCGGTINEILVYDDNLHINTCIVPKNVTTASKHCANQVPYTISDYAHIANKNVGKNGGSECASKPAFNLNAKEYVPLKIETLNAREYIPPAINIKSNAECEGRHNLFDIIPNPENTISAKTKPIVDYSEEDNVSIDFNEKIKKVDSKYCQTTNNTNFNSIDYNKLEYLQSELFRIEEEYNNVLRENNVLKKQVKESLAKPKKCGNCAKLESALKEKEDALTKLKKLEKTNNDLNSKIKELESALNAEVLEKQSKIECNESLVKKNEIVQGKLDDLLCKMNVMSRQHAYMVQHDNVKLRNVMFDQMNCIRHAYASYFTLYENKSKHMLWELEDIKALSTAETLPSLAEIEENINAWKCALDNSMKSCYMMNTFYEHLFRQFSNDQWNNGNRVEPMPVAFPSFIVEPPNIIVRHFKSLLIVNKRLEQELQQQMNAFYKMMSTPYPGVFPQKHSPINTTNTITTNSSSNNNTNSDILVAHNSIQSRKITKQSIFNNDNDNNSSISRKENNPTNGTIPKNKASSSSSCIEASNHNASSSSSSSIIKLKRDVIGPECLINKLHEKLPLVPIDLISRAVNILRERSGGLTGKDSKQIIAEIKQILKEIAITEKCLRKSKELSSEKTIKTWKKVNNGIHWNNEDPDVNCTICFEFMELDKRMILRCQHVFHTTCIKLWLQNDSICPICRSFATLDDEYPPLK